MEDIVRSHAPTHTVEKVERTKPVPRSLDEQRRDGKRNKHLVTQFRRVADTA
jgi:hypothetical protein